MHILSILCFLTLLIGVAFDCLVMIRGPFGWSLQKSMGQRAIIKARNRAEHMGFLCFVRVSGLGMFCVVTFLVVNAFSIGFCRLTDLINVRSGLKAIGGNDLSKHLGGTADWIRVGLVILVGGGLILAISINGLLMLISPQQWFKLPDYIRMSGGLSRTQYSRGWGSLHIRFTGAILVTFMLWIIYRLIHGRS